MKYQLQYKFPGCRLWFLAHEADSYAGVHGYYTDHSDSFMRMKVRIVKIETTVLSELQ